MSIVLADDPHDTTLEGKMKVIEEALALAAKGGITKPLLTLLFQHSLQTWVLQ